MKKYFLILVLMMSFSFSLFSQQVVLKADNDKPITSAASPGAYWEETTILTPAGPCTVKEIYIYFLGTASQRDTIYIVGDPSEGYTPPTQFVLSYNMKIPPIIFNYTGKPGWDSLPVNGLHLDGLDRLVIQHRIKSSGPWFCYDNDGETLPYSSFYYNPFYPNAGRPGQFYLVSGNFLVRALIEYDFKDGQTSQPPPVPVLTDVTKKAGLVDANGDYIRATDVSVVDYNNDGWDDIAIGSYLFKNNGDGTFTNVSSKAGIPAIGPTSWGDFNNDGFIDFYANNNGAFLEKTCMVVNRDQLYKNNGDGTFTAIDSKSIFKTPYPSPGVDFNLSPSYQQDSIFNPYSCISPVWLDYNGDGRLDLFLANNRVGFTDSTGNYAERYFPDELWIQGADGKFTNIRQTSGIAAGEPFTAGTGWYGYYDCYGASATDYNNDNKPDIFVANYRLIKDNLYKNMGNGTFTEVAAQTGVQGVPTAQAGYFGHGMGEEWADFNNDGLLDLCVGNLGHPDVLGQYANPSLIFQNLGAPNYNFNEVHSTMGLKFFEMNAGILWVDLDLDGYQDLWHGQISYNAPGTNNGEPLRPGHFYLNQGPPNYKLKDMTWFYGALIHGPWSAARTDFDHDGDPDVLVCSSFDGVRLYRNDISKTGKWLAIRLKGSPADNVNMDAYGTKVFVYGDGKQFMRYLGGLSGTKTTQSTNELLFGLGNISKIDSVRVVYPNSASKTYTTLQTNLRYTLPYMAPEQPAYPSVPMLISPDNFKIGVSTNATFKWQQSNSATSYDLEVFSDSALTNRLNSLTISSGSESTILPQPLENGKVYYWRVRAIQGMFKTPWSSVWSFIVGNLIPNPPQLALPVNDSVEVWLNPNFAWKDATYNYYYPPKSLYTIELSKDLQFGTKDTVLTNIADTKLSLAKKLDPGTKYYWRIKALNVDIFSNYSSVWSFTTMNLAAAPILVKPADGEINVKVKPTLGWTSIPGVSGYHIQISDDDHFGNIVYEIDNISSISLTIFKKLESNKKYWWRVQGNKNGYPGNWSSAWTFTTTDLGSVQDVLLAKEIKISANPNPLTNCTIVTINMIKDDNIDISVYNSLGQKVTQLEDNLLVSGEYKYIWNSDNVPNGIYYISLTNGKGVISYKLVVSK